MRLRWTTPAANDLYAIVEHIQQDNPLPPPKWRKLFMAVATP